MTKPARRAPYLLFTAIVMMVTTAPCTALATAGPYLNWSSKAQPATDAPAQTEQVNTPTGAYPIPPSPYGQIGDPYARSLRWPSKPASVNPAPVVASMSQPPPPQFAPQFAPVPAAPMRAPQPVSVSQPVPMTAPQPVAVVPVPAPQPEREDPGLADDPDLTPEAAPEAPTIPQPAPKPAVKAAAVPAPPAPVRETAPPPAAVASAISSDGAYQVPTNSKYAARIAAARAAQLPVAEAPQNAKDMSGSKSTATAPEPDVSLASEETDHVFIPGEQYKTPADEPRLYSLHRQYGMQPDPITVTPGATGALLTVSPEEGGDPNDDDKDSKKSDTDKN